jgi:Fe-S oxidoreductase
MAKPLTWGRSRRIRTAKSFRSEPNAGHCVVQAVCRERFGCVGRVSPSGRDRTAWGFDASSAEILGCEQHCNTIYNTICGRFARSRFMNLESPYLPKVLPIIVDNMRRSGNPLGISATKLSSWADGLDLPSKGETLLYTSCDYQLIPYMLTLVDQIKRMGPFGYTGSMLTSAAMGLRRVGLDVTAAFAALTAKDEGYYNSITRMYAEVLRKHGLDFAYLGEQEPYSGALLYEFGFTEEFAEHAKKVSKLLKERNVRTVIVTSPHALEAFRVLYPNLVEGFDVETLHFTEALMKTKQSVSMALKEPLEVTLHDPCHLARTLNITEEPRDILSRVRNLSLKEVPYANKRWTTCCGAPIETLLPSLSEPVAAKRIEELASSGAGTALTLCAFCLANLRKGASGKGLKVMDFVEVLHRALEAK